MHHVAFAWQLFMPNPSRSDSPCRAATIVLLFTIASLICLPASLAAAPLEAGAARIEITPPVGYPLWGYASRKDQPSTGVRDPLQARALVLAVGAERVALVSLDLGRPPPRQVVASLRKRLKASVGIDQLFLVASHTHHGPVLELDDWPAKAPYLRQLEDKLCTVIEEAARVRRPARVAVAAKEVMLNRNRHSRRPDAPVDRQLLLLQVRDSDGKLIAQAINFAAHVTILEARDRRLSADWPGALAAQLEKETGVPCLFLQGAAGDLSPNISHKDSSKSFARSLADEVRALAETLASSEPAESSALQMAEDDFCFKPRLDLSNPFMQTTLGSAFFPALIAFYEREYRPGVRPHLSVALLDKRIGFVGVSGEFFCAHALSLKRRARLDHLVFLGYCNDYQQYFPTIEALAEHGYGTEPWIAPAEAGAGERMMDRALIHLYRMRGKIAPASRP